MAGEDDMQRRVGAFYAASTPRAEVDDRSAATTSSTAPTSDASAAANTERLSRNFHRHQTVEVLPRARDVQAAAFQKERGDSELFRSFTSENPLNGRLRQHLLDDNAVEATPMTPVARTTTRAMPMTPRTAARRGILPRVPSVPGLGRNSSWRVFYRNLPRPLRFRQNTRSTTRYIDPSNAAPLQERLRAQREEASRLDVGVDVYVDDDDYDDSQPPPQPMPGLQRQRSNFEDVGKYSDYPVEGGGDRTEPSMVPLRRGTSSLSGFGGSTKGSVRAGRTSSVLSLESTGNATQSSGHRVIKINPEPRQQQNANDDAGGHVEDPEDEQYFPSNNIKTFQYSWWSFVPVFLYLTFQKTANLYFLLIGIFQMIPDISPTDGVPLQFIPLTIVTIIDAVFAGFEDYKRHIADHQANSAPTRVYNRELKEFEDVQWSEVRVGDFVKIQNHETIPADVLILAVVPAEGTRGGGNTGVCYVETKNLDGETNLKLREAPRVTRYMFDSEEDAGEVLQGYLESEMPNGDINRYSGTLYIHDNDTFGQGATNANGDGEGTIGTPITLKNMLLRGSKLRNTKYAYGLVVNTGVDSKIMMSSGNEFTVKVSSIDEMTNRQVIMVVLLLFAMSLVGALGNHHWLGKLQLPPEVDPDDIPRNIIGTFVYYFTTLASMVPITLYVSITMVKALQAYFMEQDLDMYDAEGDVRMSARNMQLNEQLGQVSHIFSDKTGTLTCNKMEFRKCSINGKSYGKGTTAIGLAARMRKDFKGDLATPVESSDDENDEFVKCPAPNVNFKDRMLWEDMKTGNAHTTKIREFFTHLALCHGVLIERLDTQLEGMDMPPSVYSASSPDEQALVSGAKYFGFEFVSREPGSLSIKTPEGDVEIYDILEVFEFDSSRKRMTVVVQKRKSDAELRLMTEADEEEVLVLCKGADNVLFPRLVDSPVNQAVRENTLDHLESFARDGLRTLVICSKVLSVNDWEEYYTNYRRACADLREVEAKSRGEKNVIDALQDEMEQGLDLLGATAIEDRLQDGVPESMERLAKAGINIWVLTGDMEETAINIGYACRLLNNDMRRHVINGTTYRTKGSILRRLDKIFHCIHEDTKMGDEEDDVETLAAGAIVEHALVIDGACLSLILADPLYNLHLLRVALLCKVVVACRVSPQQKAQLVELVKLNVPDSHTLSIGDGANDVPMIQSAHIGVGISGQEGMQAVNSSDYAVGQFRFLSTLLLTHGRWNYNRIAMLTVYTFYKNIVYCVSMFWYCLKISGYSGTMIYSALIQQGYNLFFTALPIMVYSVFDRDLPKEVVLDFPALYHPSTRSRTLFTYSMFWKWIVMGVVDSVGVYGVILAAGYNIMRYGDSVEYTVLMSVAWTILCIVVNARFLFMVNSWDIFEVVCLAVTIIILYLFQYVVDLITWSTPDYDTYSFPWIFERSQFWLGPLLAVVAIFCKEFFYEGYRRRFTPDYMDLVKEHIYLAKDKGSKEWANTDEELKNFTPPAAVYLSQDLVKMMDYRERREQERAPVRFTAPGRAHRYHGFAFDQPAYVVNWIFSSGGNGGGHTTRNLGPTRCRGVKPEVRKAILESEDPVIFENERYQPFCGFGSTYPGYLLPTDRSRWSNRSGKISAMSIPLAGLEVNMNAPGCDEDGWVYEKDFKAFPSQPPVKLEGDSGAETPNEGTDARPRPSSKPVGPFRGLVRRREWLLSGTFVEMARAKREALAAEANVTQQESL